MPHSHGYQAGRHNGAAHQTASSHAGGSSSFKEFLFQHVELALQRGFDDNVGRNPVAAVFEVGSPQYILISLSHGICPGKLRAMCMHTSLQLFHFGGDIFPYLHNVKYTLFLK